MGLQRRRDKLEGEIELLLEFLAITRNKEDKQEIQDSLVGKRAQLEDLKEEEDDDDQDDEDDEDDDTDLYQEDNGEDD